MRFGISDTGLERPELQTFMRRAADVEARIQTRLQALTTSGANLEEVDVLQAQLNVWRVERSDLISASQVGDPAALRAQWEALIRKGISLTEGGSGGSMDGIAIAGLGLLALGVAWWASRGK